MTRRLGVLAWVAATILSVAVSTAAVARVRAQVTERPAVVSIATLRRATTTTMVEAVAETRSTLARSATSTTTTTPPDTTTTTRASVEATPATTVETLPPAPTSPPATEPPGGEGDRGGDDDGDDPGGQPATETRTFRGGTVTVSYDGSSLTLVNATPEEGYELEIEEQSSERIVVRFVDEGRSSALVAQIIRGRLQMRVFD